MKDLHGMNALVTGVGRQTGIGFAICSGLAARGANVFFTYYRSYDTKTGLPGNEDNPETFAADFEACGVRVASLEINLMDATAPEKLMSAAIDVFGDIQILINNACVSETSTLYTLDDALLERHIAVNVRAPILLTKAFAEAFKSVRGRVVNLVSGQSLSVMENELAYTTTKAALEMFTKQVAHELIPRGITVNAIDPGPVDTGWMSDEVRKGIIETSGMGKININTDAAKLVLSFMDESMDTVTGTVLHAVR